jgi:squalene cyclase
MSVQACELWEYVPHESSQIVHTAWATLALMAANRPQDRPYIERGIQFLISKQVASGDWPHEGITGVFNNNCMITYMNYRNEFPIKALGRYLRLFGSQPSAAAQDD